MPSPYIKLSAAELDKGLVILKRHGCSDVFPDAFEIHAIEHCWGKVRPVLEKVDLLCHKPSPVVKIVAPRQRYTTRMIALVDPIDTLLLNSFSLRIGPQIEKMRALTTKNVVFSGRVNPSLSDELFDFRIDHEDFRGRIKARLKERRLKYVATADINDFYPRIYLHRLQNALSSMLADKLEARVFMNFLEAWSGGTSYGIPVGPHFSHLLAEATLHEVDTYLLSQDIDFMRYVDDYVFFGVAEADCLRALFVLGSRLQETQGLSLNSAKTRVWTSKDYRDRLELRDRPEAKRQKIILDRVFAWNLYDTVSYDDLDPSQKALLNKLDVKGIIEKTLANDQLTDLASIKFVLNMMSALGRPELSDVILNNLGKLHPVSSAVARFFRVFDDIDRPTRHQISAKLMAYINSGAYVPEFQAMWLLDVFATSSDWNSLDSVRRVAQNSQCMIVRRQAVLALGQLADRSSLLDVKARCDSALDWEQRAIVYACRALPTDERDAFLKTVNPGNDWGLNTLLLKSVIEYTKK
jgi:Reverse transcriptase (RNA-dependent DNA polymerase)